MRKNVTVRLGKLPMARSEFSRDSDMQASRRTY
jgi:hypothetical protein